MTERGPARRLNAVDQFRGIAILLMVLANYLYGSRAVPSWLRHSRDIGFTVPDAVAPLFILAIGLTYGLSLRRRRERDGLKRAVEHFVERYLALGGLGFAVTLVERRLGLAPPASMWGVLQAIGLAGLITLPAAFLAVPLRALAGLALLGAYQALLGRYWLGNVLKASHGGLEGGLAWGAMLILATCLGDLYADQEKRGQLLGLVATGLLVAGLILAIWVPVSKPRVSASYVLVSLGVGAAVFLTFHVLSGEGGLRMRLLTAWGRNPLLLYLLQYPLLALYVLPGVPWWYPQAPPWLEVLQAAFLVGALGAAALVLDRKRWYISL